MRQIKSLNYAWEFHSNFRDEFLESWYKVKDPNLVDFPHNNVVLPFNGFSPSEYQRIFCYRKFLDIPESLRGQILIMRFAGVAVHVEVYLNAELIVRNVGAYIPFEVNITDKVRYGEENLLVFKVDCYEDEDVPPFGKRTDFLTYGGVYREVNLHILSPEYITDYLFTTKNVTATGCQWEMDIEMSSPNLENRLLAQLCDSEGEVVCTLADSKVTDSVMSFSGEINSVRLWDLAHPYLYNVKISLMRDGDTLDDVAFRTGFAKMEFLPSGFVINDRKVKLVGVTRNQSYPYVGNAMPVGAQVQDADFIKSLGFNCVRCRNAPPSEHFVNRCDEIGLLVFVDLPAWKTLGDDKYKRRLKNNLTAMIVRDRNHVSVAAWGIRAAHSEPNQEFYRELNQIAKQYDNTRPTYALMDESDTTELFEDIYAVCDFSTSNDLHLPKKRGSASYILAEFSGERFATRSSDRESRRRSQALAHARALDEVFKFESVAGVFAHTMSDYNTHNLYERGDAVSYYGLSDMFRLPKTAAMFYASQLSSAPVLEIAGESAEGFVSGYDGFFAFTNCDFIKLYCDGEYAGNYYPDFKSYPRLKHPPIDITDVLGNRLATAGIGANVERLIKRYIKHMISTGGRLTIKSNALLKTIALLCGKPIGQMQEFIDSYAKGVKEFVFEGYRDGSLVQTVTRAAVKRVSLVAACNKKSLEEGHTYDVAKIELRYTDEYGNTQSFINHPITIKTNGSVEVIGPSIIALNGGCAAVWVRSKGAGEASVTFSSIYNEQTVEFVVVERTDKT